MTHENQQPPTDAASGEQPSASDRVVDQTPAAGHEQLEYAHPEIWVGSLADYNNGDLHGVWMDAARPADALHADIQRMLASGPAARRGEAPEEWGIFDHEGFGALQIGEYEQIEVVSQLAQAIAAHGPAFAAFAATTDQPLADVSAAEFRDLYVGRFDTVVDYARELAADLGYDEALDELPDHVRSYARFDYEQFARDLESGDVIISAPSDEGGVFIFRTE